MTVTTIVRPECERMAWASGAQRKVIEEAEGILLDWDGCAAIGNRPSAAAVRLITRYRDRIAIVSNNTTHLPEDIWRILQQAGVSLPVDRIVLAGTETLRHAAGSNAARVLLFADDRLRKYGRSLGLNLAREQADLVVLLRDTRFTYRKLERAANALQGGARLVVANADLTHPGPRQRIVPETGALLAALMACVAPHDVQPEIIGKPSRVLFERACAALGVAPEETVMIGDNPATDIAGADACGLKGVLIGPRSGLTLADLAGDMAVAHAAL